IGYELKVTIHTCGFGINTWTQSLPIPVYRVPKEGSSWDFALADSLRMRAEWLGAVELEVLSDSVSVTAKSKINVRAVIRPLQKNQMLVDIGLRLYERTKVKSSLDRFGDPIKSERLICQSHMRTDDPEGELNVLPLRHEYCFDLDLCIPQAFSDIQYDTDTSHLSIKHELVFTATVLDKSQNPHYLRISSPIVIVSQNALGITISELPIYSRSSLDQLLLSNMDDKCEFSPSYPEAPAPPTYTKLQII
ncbi:hypothetical protein GGI05_001737, partial [Coemansia sp. RSA 2603]